MTRLEAAVLILFAAGCSAGLTLGLDRVVNGEPRSLVCTGARIEDGKLTVPPLPGLPQ